MKKIQMSRFINTELKSDSDSSDLEVESKESTSDAELMAELKSVSDSGWISLLSIFAF